MKRSADCVCLPSTKRSFSHSPRVSRRHTDEGLGVSLDECVFAAVSPGARCGQAQSSRAQHKAERTLHGGEND